MKPTDRAEFVVALNLAYTTQRQPLPPLDALRLWESLLEPYSIGQVTKALSAHMRESSFAPVPADVIKRIGGSADSRPGVEEAWAIAVQAMDERETVVMNNEISESMATARAIFDLGDEVGARMAFREVYTRLVTKARADGMPAVWWPSLGTNREGRHVVLQKAVADGLLSPNSPVVQASLPAPDDALPLLTAAAPTTDARAALDSLRKLLSRDRDAEEAERQARLAAERATVDARKAELRGQAVALGLNDEGYDEVKPE